MSKFQIDSWINELSMWIDIKLPLFKAESSFGINAIRGAMPHINRLISDLESNINSFSDSQREIFSEMKAKYEIEKENLNKIAKKASKVSAPRIDSWLNELCIWMNIKFPIFEDDEYFGVKAMEISMSYVDRLMFDLRSNYNLFSDSQREIYIEMEVKYQRYCTIVKPFVNFTAISPIIRGHKIDILGFAHPKNYHDDLANTIEAIAVRSNTLISLDKEYAEIVDRYLKLGAGKSHHAIIIDDFHAPTIKQFEELYKIVSNSAKLGQEVAMHCGEGYGRTGTMLASLILQASLENKFLNNPAIFQNYKVNATAEIVGLGCHSKKRYTHSTQEVYHAIELVRRSGMEPYNSNRYTLGQPVENVEQVKALVQLEQHLVEKFKNKYNSSVSQTKSGKYRM